jgi:hypothetical protein
VKRQFITKTEIDRLLDQGGTVLEVDDQTTVTDLAREYAQQRGVTLRRTGGGGGAAAGSPSGGPSVAPSVAEGEDRVRASVRSAVIAQLGEVPPDLDGTIDRIIARGS